MSGDERSPVTVMADYTSERVINTFTAFVFGLRYFLSCVKSCQVLDPKCGTRPRPYVPFRIFETSLKENKNS